MHPSDHARDTPDKPAYIIAGSGEVVSYCDLDRRSNQGAHLFRELGLAPGEAIAIFMEQSPRFMEVVWAAQRAGLYYVGVPTRLTADELAYMLIDSNARVLISSPALLETARKAANGLTHVTLLQSGREPDKSGFDLLRMQYPETPIDDEAPGQDLLYSSGTTGRPKGIRFPPLTGGIGEEATTTTRAKALYGIDRNTVYLSPAPLYHAAPLRFVTAVHQVGGTAIIMEKFDPEEALALIERHRVTHAQFVPTHFVRMLKLPAEVRTRYDLSSLKVAIHAAAPCPVEVKRQMLDWWGPIIYEYYSSTETIGLTSVDPHEWLERPGTVGRAKMGEVHICGEAGEVLGPRQEGVVYFSGGRPLSYHNDPVKTAEAHNDKGWATVGDIGWLDEGGYLYLTDRQSFMIISGGVNIYPQEIENALVTHPDVADAAVIGAPDEEMGEKVVAVIEPAPGIAAGEALTRSLQQHLRTRISGAKMPRQFDYVERLPREPTGKLFKRAIRDRYWP